MGGIGCLSILLLDITGFIAGVVLMLTGFMVIMVEAPCCCMFIDFVQKVSDLADSRPYWNRAALYCV